MQKRPKLPALGTPSSGSQAQSGLPTLPGEADVVEGSRCRDRAAAQRSAAHVQGAAPGSPLSPQRPFEEDGRHVQRHHRNAGGSSSSSSHVVAAGAETQGAHATHLAAIRSQALPSLSDRSTGAPSVTPSAATSAHSSRRSSSSSRGFDQQYPPGQVCPAPPPEALSNGFASEPARSRRVVGSGGTAVYEVTGGALTRGRAARTDEPVDERAMIPPGGRSKSVAETAKGMSGKPAATRQRSLSSAGTPSGAATPERAESGSRTPTGTRAARLGGLSWAGSSGNLAAEALSSPSSPSAAAPMMMTRAGWSGSLAGDQEAAAAEEAKRGVKRDEVQPCLLPSPPSSPLSRRQQRPAGLVVRSDSMKDPRTQQLAELSPVSHTTSSAEASSPTRVNTRKNTAQKEVLALPPSPASPCSSTASAGSSGVGRTLGKAAKKMTVNPRASLTKGSRDDSFLSTISESTRSSDSTSTEDRQHRDSKLTVLDGSQIEVFSEFQNDGRMHMDVVKDFRELFVREGEKYADQMYELLRANGFDKPLDMQRRVIPLVMSAFSDEQKSFITVQGGQQCGKTFALVLGILAALGAEAPGIRVVVLSTTGHRDFKRYVDVCSAVHPLKLECFECTQRKVSFEGLPLDPDSAVAGFDPLEDLQRIASAQSSGTPVMVFGHPSRVLPLLRESPSWNVDLSNVQVLVLDDAEETICMGLMDEVCEVTTILRHFSQNRLRHILLSHFLSHEAKSMIRCLRNSLLRQQNLFGIRAHRTQARAKSARHYYAVAPRARWPSMLAVLHHALALPSGIIFDDASSEARAQAKASLRGLGVTASVWNALAEQASGSRAAARDAAAAARRGPAFHLMPSDLVVLKVDLPQVRCVLHFEVPRRELSVYGLRLMCLEQQDSKKTTRKQNSIQDGRGLSVLFVEEEDVVRDLEKTFHIKMQEVPTEMLRAG